MLKLVIIMKFNEQYFNKVYNLLQKGDTEGAMKMLDEVPENHPEYPKSLFYKSLIMKNDDNAESINMFNKAIEMQYIQSALSRDIKEVYEMALGNFEVDEFEIAMAFFDLCIEKNYNVAESKMFKIECLLNLGLIDDADELIDEVLKTDENNAEAVLLKSRVLGKMEEYEESLKFIDKAIELDPEYDRSYPFKALIYFMMERHDEAFEYIDKHVEGIEGALLKANFYRELEDYENVEKCFEIAENIDSNNEELLISKSVHYLDLGEFEKANENIDKCLKIDPEDDLYNEIKLRIILGLEDEDLKYDGLQEIYQNKPEVIDSYMEDKMSSMSLYSDEDSDKYALEEYIIYGKDYPTEYMNYNLYNVLKRLKDDSDLYDVYTKVEFKNLYSTEILTNILINDNYIEAVDLEEINVEKEVNKKSAQELSDLLEKEGITASGKKKKLVKMAVKSVPPIKFCTKFSVTSKGDEFIKDFSWFDIYDECLIAFNLNDVSKYLDDHKNEDNIDVLNEYIVDHIDLAHEKEDFQYLDDCYISLSLFYMYLKDYENCLCASLNEIILKFNPVYEYELDYAIYNIIYKPNIEKIKKCLEKVDIDIEELFYEMWDLKDSKEDFCSKEEGFSFLKRALDGEDLDDLSDEYEEKFIGVIARD